MKEINRELFEAFVFSLPQDREFNFNDCCGCALASFLRECTQYTDGMCSFGTYYSNMNMTDSASIPEWLISLLHKVRFCDSGMYRGLFTGLNLQDAYIKLFGDPRLLPDPETKSIVVEKVMEPVDLKD